MRGARRPLVLCYHALSEHWDRPVSVTPADFAEQLALLARRGFEGRTFSDAVASASEEPTVAITFDDACRSVLELAKPILDRYEMPATVFAPTAFVGDTRPLRWAGIDGWTSVEDERELMPLSWQELGQLADAGWEIGSHTRTHPRLTQVDRDRLEDELRGSKDDCERALGRTCHSLAYPYGDHDESVVAAAVQSGYLAGATLSPVVVGKLHPLAYPRVGVYFRDGGRGFRVKISSKVLRLRSTAPVRAIEAVRARVIARRAVAARGPCHNPPPEGPRW